MGDDRYRFGRLIEPDLESLALFPSELDGNVIRATSSSPAMRVASLADFSTEDVTQARVRADGEGAGAVYRQTPIASPEPTPRSSRVALRPVMHDQVARPVLPPRRDAHSNGGPFRAGRARQLSARWLTSVALVIFALGAVVVMRTPMFSTSVADSDGPAAAVVGSELPAVEDPEPPPATDLAQPATVTEIGGTVAAVTPKPASIVHGPAQPEGAVTRTATAPRPERQRLVEGTSIDQQAAAIPTNAQAIGVVVDRAKFQGTLSVDSHVAGAQVFISGKPVGVTPLVDWQLPAGSHVVRIELDGYERWSTVVQVVTGQTVNLVATLRSVERN